MVELMRRFLGPYRTKALVGILTKLVEVVFEVLTPLVVACMIDEGVQKADLGRVIGLGGLLLAFAGVSYAFTFVCQRLAAHVSQGVGTDIRDALFARVMGLSSAELDRFGTPSLITRITNDINQVQLAVALTIRTLTRWPLLALGSVIAALAIDVRLGAVFLVCLPAIYAVFGIVMRASGPYYRAMQAKLDRISLVTREYLSGMRVVRAFRQEGREEARGRAAIVDQTDTAVAVGRLSALLNPVTFLVMNAGVVALLWTGAGRVDAGELTVGQVMALVSYMSQALVAVTTMTSLVVVLMRGQTSSMRILEVLDCEPSVRDGGGGQDPAKVGPGEVCRDQFGNRIQPPPSSDGAYRGESVPALLLEDVSFTYRGSSVGALSHVSLELAEGGMLGVIGGTGSGKSTLVRLLPRLYDATSGSVRVFGPDVRTYRLKDLRRLVSSVPQDVSLVSGTVRSNLSWRDPSATDDELWEALETAQAAGFVRRLADGLDAPVEAGGRNFSGGQRQRLTIARALVGNPRLVVLDDAASALDFATDARLRRALRARRRDLTTVIVSQRVSAVRDADLILVLHHGRVRGLGTHAGLVEGCELYRQICASQGALGSERSKEVDAHG